MSILDASALLTSRGRAKMFQIHMPAKSSGDCAQLKSLCGKGKICTSAAEAALTLLYLRRG